MSKGARAQRKGDARDTVASTTPSNDTDPLARSAGEGIGEGKSGGHGAHPSTTIITLRCNTPCTIIPAHLHRHSRGRGNPEKSKARRSSTSTDERPEGERSETMEMPADAQVMISTPNFYRLEIAHSELPDYNAALTPALDVHYGFYHVSDRTRPRPRTKPRLHGGRPRQIPDRLSLPPLRRGKCPKDKGGPPSFPRNPALQRTEHPSRVDWRPRIDG